MTKDPLKTSYDIGIDDRTTFDWPDVRSVLKKVEEEIQELKESIDLTRLDQAHELGDVLFTLVQVARHLNLDPSLTLEIANQRYLDRMNEMKKQISEANLKFENLNLEELDNFWRKAKLILKDKEHDLLSQNF